MVAVVVCPPLQRIEEQRSGLMVLTRLAEDFNYDQAVADILTVKVDFALSGCHPTTTINPEMQEFG